MKLLWLVDVDGVVIDKTKMWRQLDEIFSHKFPNLNVNFWDYYKKHRGENHSVNVVMESLKHEYGIDEDRFISMFDEVDYEACFEHEGWNKLVDWADKGGMELVFFTQGTRWVQEAKKRQIDKFAGERVWKIYEQDKMEGLNKLKEDYLLAGKIVVGLIDDLLVNRMKAESECGLKTVERL